jgi:hypothetical protein
MNCRPENTWLEAVMADVKYGIYTRCKQQNKAPKPTCRDVAGGKAQFQMEYLPTQHDVRFRRTFN